MSCRERFGGDGQVCRAAGHGGAWRGSTSTARRQPPAPETAAIARWRVHDGREDAAGVGL